MFIYFVAAIKKHLKTHHITSVAHWRRPLVAPSDNFSLATARLALGTHMAPQKPDADMDSSDDLGDFLDDSRSVVAAPQSPAAKGKDRAKKRKTDSEEATQGAPSKPNANAKKKAKNNNALEAEFTCGLTGRVFPASERVPGFAWARQPKRAYDSLRTPGASNTCKYTYHILDFYFSPSVSFALEEIGR